MMNKLKHLACGILSFIVLPTLSIPAKALDIIYGESSLCLNRSLDTVLEFSTREFKIAICFRGDNCVYETEAVEKFIATK